MNGISIPQKKKNNIKTKNFYFFLHMLLKSEIIWTRIGQIIRLQNDINFSETPWR